MDLVNRSLAAILLALMVPLAWAQGLSISVGNTVAAQSAPVKTFQFVFRVNGCGDFSKAQVTAKANGIVGNERRSVPLDPRQVPTQAGVYAIAGQWGTDGTWVVAIGASCLGANAGAIVPVNARGFVRESTKLLSHTPSQTEIDLALDAYASPVAAHQ
jgi:hypothetical protein